MAIGITAKRVPQGKAPLEYLNEILQPLDGGRVCAIVPTIRNLRRITRNLYKSVEVFAIREFTSYANHYEGVNVPKQLRPYYLKKCVEQLSNDEKLAVFKSVDSELFTKLTYFIKTSSGILSFYRELSAEMITPEKLAKEGLYTDYETQINVLSTLWQNYVNMLANLSFTDEWEARKQAKYRDNFINRYDTFVFLISGFLTKYEQEQLKTLSQHKEVILVFNYAGELNQQHKQYEKNLGISIETQKLAELSRSNTHIIAHESYLAEFEYITNEIFRLHNSGISLEDMAIILPDEKMKAYFLHLDKYNLFDISSNEDIDSAEFFSTLNMLLDMRKNMAKHAEQMLEIKSVIDILHAPHLESDENSEHIKTLNKLIENDKLYIKLSELQHIDFFNQVAPNILSANDKGTFSYFIDATIKYVDSFADTSPNDKKTKIDVKSHLDMLKMTFANIDDTFTLEEAYSIIITELSTIKQVTPKGLLPVIGLLESRNMKYKAVFIPMLNDDVFPPSNAKDLFLNTEIRNRLALPTHADRENLVKNYVQQIVMHADYAYISYVENKNTGRRSSFVDEIIINNNGLNVTKYNISEPKLISHNKPVNSEKLKEITIPKTPAIVEKIKGAKISATRFNMYAKCSLQYYFNYIVGIKDEQGELDEDITSLMIGNAFHNAFDKTYQKGIKPTDSNYANSLREEFITYISEKDVYKYSQLEQFRVEDIIKDLPTIAATERERAENGYETIARELKLSAEYKGFTLDSTIDKLERSLEGCDLIDIKYKSSVNENKTIYTDENYEKLEKLGDWQMYFYAHLVKVAKGIDVEKLYHFDVKNSFKLVEVAAKENLDMFVKFFDEKLDEMVDADVAFTQTTNKNFCSFCHYTELCERKIWKP